LITDAGLETIYAETVAHEARLTGELYKPHQDLSRRATYVSCTSARQTLLVTAAASAQSYITNAYAYLNNGTTGARYTTWFGTYTSSRYSTVKTHFANLNARQTSSNTYDCSCTDSSYAYTVRIFSLHASVAELHANTALPMQYAAQTGKMWLCNAFWSAPNTGTDSKAGTIIHEST